MSITTLVNGSSAWSKGDYKDPSIEYRVTYEGCVLQTFERNGYDDSDFMAIVVDLEAREIKTVTYATTRGWTYANSAVVDVTPENLAIAQEIARESNVRLRVMESEWASKELAKGGQVLPAGSTGYVAALVVNSYRTPRYAAKSGHRPSYDAVIQYEGRLLYIDDDAVEVVNPEQYVMSHEDADALEGPATNITNFHRPVPGFVNMI